MMRESYDFSKAIRGAHYQRYAEGHSVRLIDEEAPQTPGLSSDASVTEEGSELELVSLDPDVRAAFPDSRAVNEALRLLIKTAKSAQEFAKMLEA